jgi:hypothetical protein
MKRLLLESEQFLMLAKKKLQLPVLKLFLTVYSMNFTCMHLYLYQSREILYKNLIAFYCSV